MLRARATALVLSAAAVLAVVCALIAWQTSDRDFEPATDGTTTVEAALGEEVAPVSSALEAVPAANTPEPAAEPKPASSSTPPDERSAYAEIQTLAREGRIGAARSRANAYYERFPNGPASAEIERLTGAHPVRDQEP